MKTFLTATVIILTLLAGVESPFAMEWRGLTPLRSTRADVVRLLNQCSDQKEACAFTLGNENVYILFSGGLTDDYAECERLLPAETIMFIDIELKATPKIKSLSLENKKFRTFNPSEPYKMGLKGYWNENDGFLINTLRGKVIQLDYLSAPADQSRCAGFYEEPASFIKMVPVHVPIVSVDCPAKPVRAGDKIAFSALTNVNAKRGYTWTVSSGKIISGQFTHQITVDTTGLSGQTIVATAEIRDVFAHTAAAACKVQILGH
jgi:hypothetical protein